MAYIPMTIGGKKYSETSLWTNPSPTSNFATQNITLSESMTNYKYLLVKWKTDTSTNQIGEIIVPVDNFKSQTVSPYYNYPAMETNTANYFRAFVYTSDTQIMMANCFKFNGGTTAYNQYNIPTEVLGLNELDHEGVISDLIVPDVISTANTTAATRHITTTQIPSYAIFSSTRRDNGKTSLVIADFKNEQILQYDASGGSYTKSSATFSQTITNVTSTGFDIPTTSGVSCHNIAFIYY